MIGLRHNVLLMRLDRLGRRVLFAHEADALKRAEFDRELVQLFLERHDQSIAVFIQPGALQVVHMCGNDETRRCWGMPPILL